MNFKTDSFSLITGLSSLIRPCGPYKRMVLGQSLGWIGYADQPCMPSVAHGVSPAHATACRSSPRPIDSAKGLDAGAPQTISLTTLI